MVGITFAIVQGWLIRIILIRIGEFRTALLGFLFGITGLAAVAFVKEGWMIYLVIPITGFGALVTPALQGIMSNLVAENSQGELQGALASIASITLIVSPWLMSQLFGFFAGPDSPVYFPGAPFLMAAIAMTIALVPFYVGYLGNKSRKH